VVVDGVFVVGGLLVFDAVAVAPMVTTVHFPPSLTRFSPLVAPAELSPVKV
jgi:hypothetical protein